MKIYFNYENTTKVWRMDQYLMYFYSILLELANVEKNSTCLSLPTYTMWYFSRICVKLSNSFMRNMGWVSTPIMSTLQKNSEDIRRKCNFRKKKKGFLPLRGHCLSLEIPQRSTFAEQATLRSHIKFSSHRNMRKKQNSQNMSRNK